jgi:hypothetical protein
MYMYVYVIAVVRRLWLQCSGSAWTHTMRRKLDPEISGGSRFASLCPCLLVLPHCRCLCLPGRPIALHSLSTEWCVQRPSSTMLAAGQSRASTLAAARSPEAPGRAKPTSGHPHLLPHRNLRNPHWRWHRDCSSAGPAGPLFAFDDGQRASRFHFDACGAGALEMARTMPLGRQIRLSARHPHRSRPTAGCCCCFDPWPGRALIVPRPTERSFGVHGMGRPAGGMGSSSPGPNAGTCPGIPQQSQHACILHPARGEPSWPWHRDP